MLSTTTASIQPITPRDLATTSSLACAIPATRVPKRDEALPSVDRGAGGTGTAVEVALSKLARKTPTRRPR
ncbi:hypothetical protein M3J09_004009 [Ascochyta lentis]